MKKDVKFHVIIAEKGENKDYFVQISGLIDEIHKSDQITKAINELMAFVTLKLFLFYLNV